MKCQQGVWASPEEGELRGVIVRWKGVRQVIGGRGGAGYSRQRKKLEGTQ